MKRHVKIFMIASVLLCVSFSVGLTTSNTTADVDVQLQLHDGYMQVGPGQVIATEMQSGTHYTGILDANGHTRFMNIDTPVNDGRQMPSNYSLLQNFPNPFNPSTTIRYELPKPGDVKIEVYALDGSKVATLQDGRVSAGEHDIRWNGLKDSGEGTASGVYFARMKTPGYTKTIKMVKVDGGGIVAMPAGNSAPRLEKAADDGLEYQFQVIADNLDTTSLNARIVGDTSLVIPVNPKMNFNPVSANFNEGDSTQVGLNANAAFGISGYGVNAPDSLIASIDGNRLIVRGANGDVNGSYPLELIVRPNHGRDTTFTVPVTINPQPDVSGVLYDPVLKQVVDSATVRINGQNYTVVPSDSGVFKLQLSPGPATLTTDTTGGRMQTVWDLGNLGTDDVKLDTIPVFYKNKNMELMVDVFGNNNVPGDPNVYGTNRIWNPNIQHEGLPKGTLKTVYVNLNTNIGTDATRKANLDWVVQTSSRSTDNKVRLQLPADATMVDIPVSSAGEEGAIGNDFLDGKIFPDYDFMVFIRNYGGDANVTNANQVQGYTTKGVASIAKGNLGTKRAAGLSEVTTALQNTGDPTDARDEMAKGTMYGETMYFDHQNGYKQNESYGSAGNQITTSSEELVGKISMNIPLDSRIEIERIVLPAR